MEMTLDVGERSEVPPVSARSSLPPSARPLPPSDEVSAALGHARTRGPLTSRTHSQLEPNKSPLALTNGLPFGQLHILTYPPPLALPYIYQETKALYYVPTK